MNTYEFVALWRHIRNKFTCVRRKCTRYWYIDCEKNLSVISQSDYSATLWWRCFINNLSNLRFSVIIDQPSYTEWVIGGERVGFAIAQCAACWAVCRRNENWRHATLAAVLATDDERIMCGLCNDMPNLFTLKSVVSIPQIWTQNLAQILRSFGLPPSLGKSFVKGVDLILIYTLKNIPLKRAKPENWEKVCEHCRHNVAVPLLQLLYYDQWVAYYTNTQQTNIYVETVDLPCPWRLICMLWVVGARWA